jgi:hydrogenase maturation protease
VDAVGIPVGTRVRLRPRAGGDVFDLALAGKTAVVDAVETDMEGRVFVGVLVDDDPGRDLGERGHRFFFSPEEVEPLRVLVAGIGNVFLGDDGFGCALARRVAVEGVDIVDFGIRGMDLAYALADYDLVVFLDATPRGEAPGTLYLIEPDLDGLPLDVDAHAMHPVSVLALAKTLGGELPRTLVLGCEPAGVEEFTDLSEPVRAALVEAEKLLAEVLRKET